MRYRTIFTAMAATVILALAVSPVHADATAAMKDANGKDVGTVELVEAENGVLLSVDLEGLPAGEHAFHVHAVGKCEPPFTSAAGHFNPEGKKHGLLADGGQHAGDMPNIHVPDSGELTIEILNENITLEKGEKESLFDADGSAIVIHAKGDDYESDPAGDAGPRIACGVIR